MMLSTPLTRAVVWGAAWGMWTCGLPLLVLQGCRSAWILRPFGLPNEGDLAWSAGLDPVNAYAARWNLPPELLLSGVLSIGVLLGVLVMLALHLLDPGRKALASLLWSTCSAWTWFLALPAAGAMYLFLITFSSLWLPDYGFASVAATGALPALLSWCLLHPGNVSTLAARLVRPRPAAGRQDFFVWLALATCVMLASSLEIAGFLLAIPLRAVEVHWLMQRGRRTEPLDLVRDVLRVSILRPWFAASLWPLAWASLLAGPLMAWWIFSNFEVSLLLDALRSNGTETPGLLSAALSVSGSLRDHWWRGALLLVPAYLIWQSFADGRLAHLQRDSLVSTTPNSAPADASDMAPSPLSQNPL